MLLLLLFLALVVLAVLVIESFEPSSGEGPRANADDVLELRLGRPGVEPAAAPAGDDPGAADG